jgi:hypothetical protein
VDGVATNRLPRLSFAVGRVQDQQTILEDPMVDHHYTVVGRWPFPPEMPGHDRSEPATPEDAEKIRRLSRPHVSNRAELDEEVSINLVMRDCGRWRPNTAKWESFDWKVPGDKLHAAMKADRAEHAKRVADLKSGLAKLSPDELEALEYHGFQPPGA